MAKASGIVSPEWFVNDDTDAFASAVDQWVSKNLQDEDLDGDEAIARTEEVDFCYSGRKFGTPLSDHEVDERIKDHIPQST